MRLDVHEIIDRPLAKVPCPKSSERGGSPREDEDGHRTLVGGSTQEFIAPPRAGIPMQVSLHG
jgi:hypothetical protein